MRIAALLVFSTGLLIFVKPAAANTCPWFTQGSAEKILGGSVSATVNLSASGEGSCTFARETGAPQNNLKIVVQKAALPSCPENSAQLKGIGNEATLCTVRRSAEESVDMVVSRVRELHFTLTMTIHREGPQQIDVNRIENAIKQAAEQVAGNLF